MQLGVRVAQSIGVWQDFVTKLVDEVDQKAAEHVAALEAAAAQRHRELTDAVAAVGESLRQQAAVVAVAMDRQATRSWSGSRSGSAPSRPRARAPSPSLTRPPRRGA